MLTQLKEKLHAYILENNPELALQLQAGYSMTSYLEDKVQAVQPTLQRLLSEAKPPYITLELCLNELTRELRPSRFNYLKQVIMEEFSADYERLVETGVVTYEVINLIEACAGHFENFGFSEENQDNRFLRYAIIAQVHDYFN